MVELVLILFTSASIQRGGIRVLAAAAIGAGQSLPAEGRCVLEDNQETM